MLSPREENIKKINSFREQSSRYVELRIPLNDLAIPTTDNQSIRVLFRERGSNLCKQSCMKELKVILASMQEKNNQYLILLSKSVVESTFMLSCFFNALSLDQRGIPRYNANPIKGASSFALSDKNDFAIVNSFLKVD